MEEGNPHSVNPQCAPPSFPSSLIPAHSARTQSPGVSGAEHEGYDLCPVLGPEATPPVFGVWSLVVTLSELSVALIVENISVCLHHAVLLLLGFSL